MDATMARYLSGLTGARLASLRARLSEVRARMEGLALEVGELEAAVRAEEEAEAYYRQRLEA